MFSVSLPAKFDLAAVDQCQQLLQQLDQLASEPYNAASTRETAQQLASCIGALDSAAKSSLVLRKAGRQAKGFGINELVEKALVGLIDSAVSNGDFASAKCALDSVKWLCCDKADNATRIETNLAALVTTKAAEFAFHAITELVGKLSLSAEQQHQRQQQQRQEAAAAAAAAADDEGRGGLMEEQGQASAALCAACECIEVLVHVPGVAKKLVQLDGCEVVTSLLEDNLAPTEAKLAACATLNRLCTHDFTRARFAENGGSSKLLRCAAEHGHQNSKLAAALCSVLAQLLRHPANQEALYQTDAIPIIARLLETCMEDANLVAALSTVVMRFCEADVSYQRLFDEAGACAAIIQALNRHANHVRVVEEALGALVNLCVVSEVAVHAAELDGDILALRALAAFPQHSLVAMRAGLVLSHACQRADRATPLLAADSSRIVTEALARQTDDALVVESLSWAITLFASKDTDDSVRAWGPRALEAVNQALQRQLISFHPLGARAYSSTCRAAAKLAGKAGLGDETVCENVWKVLVSQGHDVGVFFAVYDAMGDICRHPEHARWFIGKGVLEKIGRTLQKLSQQQLFRASDPTVAINQVLTLWFVLAQWPETRTYVTQHPELLDVLRQVAERHMHNLQLSLHVCDLLTVLTANNQQLNEMCGPAGLCVSVVRILERHYQARFDGAVIASVGCVLIRCLAVVPANLVRLSQAGACELLPATLVRHAEDDSTSFQCLQTIHMLAASHAENTLILGRSGACEAVLQVLASRIERPAFAEGCLRTMSILCCNNAVNAERLYEARISQLLLRVFQLHMELSGTMIWAIAAIVNMCTGTESARVTELGEAGLCPAVVAALATHLQSHELVESASAAIVRMCANGDATNRQRFLEGDALPVLQAAQELYECESIDQAIQLISGASTNTTLLHD